MEKNILKDLINKALKEVKLEEALCRCVYDSNPTPPNSGITQITGCGSCSDDCCQEAGYIGLANIALDSGGRNRGVRTTTGNGPTSLKKKFKEAQRPDYPDVDGDGDRKEPMAKAFKDKKAKKSEAKNASSTSCKKDSDCGSSKHDKCFKGKCMDTTYVDKKIKEAEMTAGVENTKFTIKVDVSNKQSETKLGIRIQLTPKDGMLEPDVRDKLEVAITKKLNTSLGEFDIQVSKDTDVPDPAIIGFFIPLSQIKNMIVKSIKGEAAPTNGAPTPPPPARPTPPAPAVPPAKPATPVAPATTNEVILKEMRVRDLKEISKVVIKEDFYAFINAGQNVLRTMEGKGMNNGKKYLEYLVKHNIM